MTKTENIPHPCLKIYMDGSILVAYWPSRTNGHGIKYPPLEALFDTEDV